MIGFICYDMIQWNPVGQLSIFVSYEKGNPSEGGIIKYCSTVNNSTRTKLTTAITVQFFSVKVLQRSYSLYRVLGEHFLLVGI